MNVLNIGNTHSTFGIWEKGRFSAIETLPTSRLTPEQLPEGKTVAASVVPEAARRFAGKNIVFIDALHCRKTIDFSGVESGKLGADRVANAFALVHFFDTPAVAVDCGTAITFDIVDGENRFHSGGIAPGRRLMRRALHDGTAQLPEIALSSRPPEHFGTDTVANIAFGVDRGIVGAVREMLTYIGKHVSLKTVVFTGGDAPFFLPEFPGSVSAPENFTLYGILFAAGEMQ